MRGTGKRLGCQLWRIPRKDVDSVAPKQGPKKPDGYSTTFFHWGCAGRETSTKFGESITNTSATPWQQKSINRWPQKGFSGGFIAEESRIPLPRGK
jgi:hypothetical protein